MRYLKRLYRFSVFASLVIISLIASSAFSQNSDQQSIPDAPSAHRPFPKPNVSPTEPPASPAPSDADQQTAPNPNIITVPEGGATKEGNTNSRDELFKFTSNVNFVQVPVTVKDDRGHLVAGLLSRDFEVLEDGKQQRLTFFTSDPFPLSAAVVLDQAMSDTEFAKVRETLPALVGAFGQFDEVALYTYGTSVSRIQGYVPAQNDVFLQSVKKIQRSGFGRTGGAPVLGGPFGSGPTVNGRPADPGAAQTVNQPQMSTVYRPESHVLNDAILAAAQDLATREKTRRRVIFVISNGRELNSDASFNQVVKVLNTYQITVYAIAVGESAMPVYKQLERIRLPGQGYGNILPNYAQKTGGLVFSEFTRDAIEQAYNQVTLTAKNQYTLGYQTSASQSGNYRTIEVRVRKPDLKVQAREGYYPLPPPATH
jgi:VWFA-related protein